MAGFIDQTHRKERPGMDSAFWELVCSAHLIHLVRERTTGAKISKDDITGIRKESFRELVSLTSFSRNMKFHHGNPAPKFD
ncbi:MAG TPA: hypothetical protein VHX20_00060 [Terracidiphilus sp.]|nr:hypothetical protein [Terracidiphilus sp.]